MALFFTPCKQALSITPHTVWAPRPNETRVLQFPARTPLLSLQGQVMGLHKVIKQEARDKCYNLIFIGIRTEDLIQNKMGNSFSCIKNK